MARKEAIIQLRQVLLRRRDALRRALDGDLSLLQELREQGPGDVLDAAVDTVQDELNSQLAEVESRELGQIEAALERMKDGTYGQCVECEKVIPLKRLQALPYATECIDCKRKAEGSGPGPGGWAAGWGRSFQTPTFGNASDAL